MLKFSCESFQKKLNFIKKFGSKAYKDSGLDCSAESAQLFTEIIPVKILSKMFFLSRKIPLLD